MLWQCQKYFISFDILFRSRNACVIFCYVNLWAKWTWRVGWLFVIFTAIVANICGRQTWMAVRNLVPIKIKTLLFYCIISKTYKRVKHFRCAILINVFFFFNEEHVILRPQTAHLSEQNVSICSLNILLNDILLDLQMESGWIVIYI